MNQLDMSVSIKKLCFPDRDQEKAELLFTFFRGCCRIYSMKHLLM